MKKIFLTIFCCAFFVSAAFADAGKTGSRFLLLGIGGRAVGMGEAFTGLANDVSAAYWNPAGLTTLTGIEILSMYNSWLEGISHLYAGAGMKLKGGKALAVQVNALDMGSLPRFDSSGAAQGTFGAGDIALTFSYACALGSRLSAGVNAKLIRETIETESGMGYGVDLGGLYRVSPRLNLGLTVQNLGSGIKLISDTTPLPLQVRAGAGWLMTADAKKELTLTADAACLPLDGTTSLNLGGEAVLYRMLALRSGVKIGESVVPTLGVGFRLHDISVDWATELFGDLGTPNRLSITMKFGNGENGRKK